MAYRAFSHDVTATILVFQDREIVICETSDLLEYILQVLLTASCGRIGSFYSAQRNYNYSYSQSRQRSQRKKWKNTFYPLERKGKNIFQNFTQNMHLKFIRTRWISDCQGKNLESGVSEACNDIKLLNHFVLMRLFCKTRCNVYNHVA